MIQEEISPVQTKTRTFNLCRLLAVLGLIAIIGMTLSIGTLYGSYRSLSAEVRAEGDRLYIYNNDDFEWTDVRLVLNAYNADYKLTLPAIGPHSEIILESNKLAKDDGTTLIPSYISRADIIITCRISDSQWSSWFYKMP